MRLLGERMSERARVSANILSSTTPTATNETAAIIFVCCFHFFTTYSGWKYRRILRVSIRTETHTLIHIYTNTQTDKHKKLKCAHIFRSYVFFIKKNYRMICDLWKWIWIYFRYLIDNFKSVDRHVLLILCGKRATCNFMW